MDKIFDWRSLLPTLEQARDSVLQPLAQPSSYLQVGAIVVVLALAWLLARWPRRFLERLSRHGFLQDQPTLHRLTLAAAGLALPITWVALQWAAVAGAGILDLPYQIMRVVVALLSAWIVIRMISGLVQGPAWSRLIAVLVWILAALIITDLLRPTVDLLDSLALSVGSLRISALAIVQAVISLVVLLWAALIASRVLERRIDGVRDLTPSVRVLLSKLLKIVLITAAVVVALSTLGVDLTAFAVVGGAIGVGIGFGLQKIVANLFSGIILLLDRSIKPGDVIAVGETFGWIESLGARYASVRTRDGTEHLIPNEDLITQRVENWSHTDHFLRLRVPIGVSYKSDVRRAIELCNEAAAETARVVERPPPNCLLRGFGDSSVDLELRIWIIDPENGRANVVSDVLLRVWDKFRDNDIEIPFPQRDLHLRSPAAIAVQLEQAPAAS